IAGPAEVCAAGASGSGPECERLDALARSGAAVGLVVLSCEVACLLALFEDLSELFLSMVFLSGAFLSALSDVFFSGVFFSEVFLSDGFLLSLASALLSCLAGVFASVLAAGFASAFVSVLAMAAGASASMATSAQSPAVQFFLITGRRPPNPRVAFP